MKPYPPALILIVGVVGHPALTDEKINSKQDQISYKFTRELPIDGRMQPDYADRHKEYSHERSPTLGIHL